ncbi:hypothetical protein BDN72DRAFT_764310 [Pluteus cervinus]|uniref:Uncharacterized protein n=1 Tax=Pluteus cervinus TaxID=181527 RepID=A0ACD3B4E8_9AGAR|nr:hypothetical protein BDN72DRAFT_764310 [Pluteus cervinus]
MPQPEPALPPRNEKELSREMLISILNYFSTLIPVHFNGRPVRLIVHGGACMLLHTQLIQLANQQPPMAMGSLHAPDAQLPKRRSTRDVDIIKRSFVTEWQQAGVQDAADRLQNCINITARQFGLGLDWMNSDADVALPMSNDPSTGAQYDPIYQAAVQPNNLDLHTIFESDNKMLKLISVTPFWAVALKLVRYTKWDPGDICILLR